jgi:ribosomal protein L29
MKKTDIQKINDKNETELEKDLMDAKGKLQTLRFDLAAGKIKNLGETKEVKKKIARIFTFLKQKSGK